MRGSEFKLRKGVCVQPNVAYQVFSEGVVYDAERLIA
jgi:hypothetical protein